MKTTKYVTTKEFAKISKGKNVKEFPNPLCKEINGISYEIMTDEVYCEVKELPCESYAWYICCTFEEYQKIALEKYGEKNSKIVVISTRPFEKYGHFPTELVCGVVGGVFSMHSKLAQETGCILGNANSGSSNCYFRSAKVNQAINILNENHWNCPEYK